MSIKDKDTPCLCGVCSQAISKKQYSILCFSCDRWHHIKCVDLTVAQVKFYDSELKKEIGDRWKCPPCLKETVRLSQVSRKSLTGVSQNDNSVRNFAKSVTLEDIMIKLNHIEGLYNGLLQKYNEQIVLNDSLQTEIAKLNSRIDHLEQTTEKQVSPPMNTSSSEDIIKEYYERETRKKNVIIFGQPEPNDNENMHHTDKDAVTEILNCICPHVNTSNFKVVRLGKKLAPVNAGRPRPIKVVLGDSSISSEIFRRSSELKLNPQFKHLTITSDKTPKQQMEYKNIRQQLLERKQAGETNIKIKFVRGIPAIVNINQSEN